MIRRHVVITGAGRGLGLAIAAAAAARGDIVTATLRDPARGAALRALAEFFPDRVRIVPLDVADEASCAGLAAHVAAHVAAAHLTGGHGAARHVPGELASGERGAVDVVVHNAGINGQSPELQDRRFTGELGALRLSSLEHMLRVNALGALLVTQALVPALSSTASVVCLSSRRASLAGKDRGGNYGYCVSKAALNMMVRGLAHDLAPRVVVAVHPGEVKTAMGQPDATLTPDDAAAALLGFIDRLTPALSGRFLRCDGSELPW